MAGSVSIAVTGAAGFIGSHVAIALSASGVAVRGFLGPLPAAWPSGRPPMAFASHADIVDPDALDELLEGTNTVIHAAGPSSVADSFAHPREYMRVHAVGTTALLEACVRAGVRRIVHISSAEVYGNRVPPVVSESAPSNATSPYGAAKIAAEQMVRAFAISGKVEAIALRLFSVYGPRMSARGVVSDVLRQASPRATIRVRDPRPVRDFCFVEDVAGAVVSACRVDVDGFAAVNVGSGVGTSVADLVRVCAELTGASGLEQSGEKRSPGTDVDRLVANTDLARVALGWAPSTSLRDGLRQTLAAMVTT
jgi:nucleoside-diphosphate-sugar epimerase